MCFYFDFLSNMLLSSEDFQDLSERGFKVDDTSASGLGVQEKGSFSLNESVDSRHKVLNLSTSQRYVIYTWFLTLTCNQSMFPGVGHLHDWKNAGKWKELIKDFESMSEFQQKEYIDAMENTYGIHVLNNWHTSKHLFL